MVRNRVILTKHLGTIAIFREILLRNGCKCSEFMKFCSGTGVNVQNLRNSAQERGTIIRIREILLRNGVNHQNLRNSAQELGYNHQISRNSAQERGTIIRIEDKREVLPMILIRKVHDADAWRWKLCEI